MKLALGVSMALALAAAPALAQQHDHHAAPDTAATGPRCGMGGMHGMGTASQGTSMMAPDSAMQQAMWFAPRHVLAVGDSLNLTSDQVRRIEALADDSVSHEHAHSMPMDKAQMERMHGASAAVRDLLTLEQRQWVEQLAASCPMMHGTNDARPHEGHHR